MGLWIDVRALRQSRGWLQREAAEKLGVSRVYLSAVENNRRGISMHLLESIIRVFQVKYEDFHAAGAAKTEPVSGTARPCRDSV